MYIEINPQHVRSNIMKQMLDTDEIIGRSVTTSYDASKDLCVGCLAKFRKQKAPNIITAEAVKDL